ncbi:MAG: hypothetical protein HCA25_12815 [Dolichospermum sp. DET50]|jgi:hypothetical protein|nr:hypothetical protein [Dolichospermum sp. DET66]MBS3033128.1 hypothetical protein [Dolichospermum sp. DET67]MBS3038332.1 hypothetical protein [Dolichospermum sp. DET50]QSX70225.1 MAG: hypothetical protein EZY12_12030 [Dolichospermum sp. DET69]
MSNILITDITVFTDIAIEQQENIVGGVTTPGITNPLPSYIPLNPAINGFLEAFNFNLFDLQESLNIAGLDIKLPIG